MDNNNIMIYKKYINSKKWKEKSKRFISQVGECEECGDNKKLSCHHISYKNLGFETKKDIKVLCWDCHRLEHDNIDLNYVSKKKKNFLISKKITKYHKKKKSMQEILNLFDNISLKNETKSLNKIIN